MARAPRRGDDWYAAGQLANGIYGGSFSSRLTPNIREDKGYTYSPHSSIRQLGATLGWSPQPTWPRRRRPWWRCSTSSAGSRRCAERRRADATVQYLTGTRPGHLTQSGLAETIADLLTDGKGVEWLRSTPLAWRPRRPRR